MEQASNFATTFPKKVAERRMSEICPGVMKSGQRFMKQVLNSGMDVENSRDSAFLSFLFFFFFFWIFVLLFFCGEEEGMKWGTAIQTRIDHGEPEGRVARD